MQISRQLPDSYCPGLLIVSRLLKYFSLIPEGLCLRFVKLYLMFRFETLRSLQLSSRLASCIDHDPIVASRLKHDARFYLGKLWFDAVAYGPEELAFVSEIISRAGRYESGTSNTKAIADRKEGSKRMLFGTGMPEVTGSFDRRLTLCSEDHPFFPPLSSSEKWKSVVENLEAIESVSGWGEVEKKGVSAGNALGFFGIQ